MPNDVTLHVTRSYIDGAPFAEKDLIYDSNVVVDGKNTYSFLEDEVIINAKLNGSCSRASKTHLRDVDVFSTMSPQSYSLVTE